jgi:Protein of unknown function (DUF4241)
MIPSYLTALLADSPALQSYEGPVKLECLTVGRLHLPSGRIVACDPLDPSGLSFAKSVPPGNYPVSLSVVHLKDGEFNAAAWLTFYEGTPVRWEHARWDSWKLTGEPAYAVDSAMGSFMSHEAGLILEAMEDGPGDLIDQVLQPESGEVVDAAVIDIPGAKDLNFAVFSSGSSDGVYASYWGFDAGGRPVCLLTDFDVLGLDGSEAEDSPGRKPWWKFW